MNREQLKTYTCAGQYSIFDLAPEYNFYIRQQPTTCSHCGKEYDKKTTLHICKPGDLRK